MNEPRRRGPIVRLIVGVWDAMNFTRRLFFNLLFFGLLIFLLAVLAAGGKVQPVQDRTTLVIEPQGTLVEQYSTDAASRALARMYGDPGAGEVQLRDLLRGIAAAKDDKRIERVLLRVDGLRFSGHAALRELAAAVRELRASGKQVIAYGESFDQQQYLLAAQADEVYLDPMGGVLLEGLAGYRQYFREGLQDKLGVDVHLFKVGEYKSAAEPFVLDAASPESKEADLYWMNDVWNRFLADVAAARKLDAAQLAAGIDSLPQGIEAAGGDLAQYAIAQRLVDGLKTEEEVDALMVERGIADEKSPHGFRAMTLDAYLGHVDRGIAPVDERPQVAVVVAEGGIVGGEQPPGTIGGESTSALLRAARDDESIKAVVLRIDSPGGEVFASEQIRREVDALKAAGKPVVASMGDYAASGGYWIAMDADSIYANPSTVTGSIGIFGLVPTFQRSLDKIGVHTDGVGTTRFAGAFDITRPLAPEVGEVIQSVIEKGYRDFTTRVADARGMDVTAVDAIARGRVWTGEQAKQRGLVDEFGGLRDAVADAAARAELGEPGDYRVRYLDQGASPFERFFGRFAESRAGSALLRGTGLGQALLARLLPQASGQWQVLESAATLRPGKPVQALAFCFCAF